ncbi:MAG: hypothetical protein ACI4QF_04970, partial [Kiritimatiellia bacterium]
RRRPKKGRTGQPSKNTMHDSQSDYKFNCCAVANVVQFGWILPITGVSNDNEAFVANSRFSGCVDIDCGRK